MTALLRGLLGSLSIGAGYVPIAFSFGLAAVQAGLAPSTTLLISLVVYAGASQFILIALLTSGAGLLGSLATVSLMNARHLFYGPALMQRFTAPRRSLPAPLLAFGLTDEVFAAASGKVDQVAPEDREYWYLGLQLGAYTAWVGGTLLGAGLGDAIGPLPLPIDAALGFILPALFFVLLLDVGVTRWMGTIAITAAATASFLPFMPNYHALALGMVVGATVSALGKQHGETRHAR